MAERPRHLGLPLAGATMREVALRFNNLLVGKINSINEVTLDTGTSSTAVSDINASVNSWIDFMPLTSQAATEWASGSMYVSQRNNQEFVIEHSTAAGSDRTFSYVVLG